MQPTSEPDKSPKAIAAPQTLEDPNTMQPTSLATPDSESDSESDTDPTANPPTLEEVKAAIPPEGIEVPALISLFKARVGHSPDEVTAFIEIIKTVAVQNRATKLITLKK